MHYIGIDLHKHFLMVAVETEQGQMERPRRIACQDVAAIRRLFKQRTPLTAVIEASSSYRWLYDLLEPLGKVVLAHPLRLRAIVAGRAKTDKLDAALLARLLRAHLIPESYVPPQPYHELRELTRARARLSRHATKAKNELHALLMRSNVVVPYVDGFCKSGRRWIGACELGEPGNGLRDELLRRLAHFEQEVERLDEKLQEMAVDFPQTRALLGLHGIGLFSALLIVAEIGEPWRFSDGRKVGAYAGLTARVNQSGGYCYYGNITHQGSPWLRWVLVQSAMMLVRKDAALANFYTRIRKRSSAKIARVAAARKLAGICWVRLMRWHRMQPA